METPYINLIQSQLDHIRRELDGYYTGDDLTTRTQQTMDNFQAVGFNPLHFQFREEQRYNENTFKIETHLFWLKVVNSKDTSNVNAPGTPTKITDYQA